MRARKAPFSYNTMLDRYRYEYSRVPVLQSKKCVRAQTTERACARRKYQKYQTIVHEEKTTIPVVEQFIMKRTDKITSKDAVAEYCKACQKQGITLTECSVCGTASYCSVECLKADSRAHKKDCTWHAVSQLIEAVRRNDTDEVRRLAKTKRVLNGRVDCETPPHDGMTVTLGKWSALHECVREKNTKMIQILIEHRCNLEIKDVDRETPLFIASSARDLSIVMALLNAGADPNAKSMDGWSCLMMAARDGDFAVAHALLEAGADIHDGRDMLGRTAVDMINMTRRAYGI